MSKGIRLESLTDHGGGHYWTGKTLLDLSYITDARLSLQLPQALDLGFKYRSGSRILNEICSLLENNIDRKVRFFDKTSQILFDTGLIPRLTVVDSLTLPDAGAI